MKNLNQIKRFGLFPLVLMLLSSCKAIFYNLPDITDHKLFPYRVIEHDPESVFHFVNADTLFDLGKRIKMKDKDFMYQLVPLDEYFSCTKTAVFLIIRNDSILYQKYDEKYDESSIFNPFSLTKAFMATLTGIALDEGKIKSIDQAVTDYVPELLEKEDFSEVTIRHLLVHTSGIKYSNQKFNPLSDNCKYYYGRKLRKYVLGSKTEKRPGKEFFYGSMNTQLLGLVLERATGTNLSSYLQEKLWKELGMEFEAKWSLDNRGENAMEKCASNLNCTAIDLAKLGRLYLNKGSAGEKRILSKQFFALNFVI